MEQGELEALARVFFDEVIQTLKERHQSRGDTFLELDFVDFGTFFKAKGERIRALAGKADRKSLELFDEIVDEAGYAVLACIKLASVVKDPPLMNAVKVLCGCRREDGKREK